MKYYERNVQNHKKENHVNSGPFKMISMMKAAEFVYLRYLEDPDVPKAARLSSAWCPAAITEWRFVSFPYSRIHVCYICQHLGYIDGKCYKCYYI